MANSHLTNKTKLNFVSEALVYAKIRRTNCMESVFYSLVLISGDLYLKTRVVDYFSYKTRPNFLYISSQCLCIYLEF